MKQQNPPQPFTKNSLSFTVLLHSDDVVGPLFYTAHIDTLLHQDVAPVTPDGSPGVADDPKARSVADNVHSMIGSTISWAGGIRVHAGTDNIVKTYYRLKKLAEQIRFMLLVVEETALDFDGNDQVSVFDNGSLHCSDVLGRKEAEARNFSNNFGG